MEPSVSVVIRAKHEGESIARLDLHWFEWIVEVDPYHLRSLLLHLRKARPRNAIYAAVLRGSPNIR